MYSRFQNRPEHEIRIPEHYSGCAFSPTPPPEKHREDPPRPRPLEPTRPSPPPKSPPPALLPPPREPNSEKSPVSPAVAVSQGLFGSLGKAFPFSHGLGFEELLLLGLILILGQSGSDPDMILWLALLLFCG